MLKALRFIDTSILLVYNQIKFSMSDILITFEKSGLEILMMCSGGPKPLGCSVLEMTTMIYWIGACLCMRTCIYKGLLGEKTKGIVYTKELYNEDNRLLNRHIQNAKQVFECKGERFDIEYSAEDDQKLLIYHNLKEFCGCTTEN